VPEIPEEEPALHKPAAGALETATPFAEPQAPLTCRVLACNSEIFAKATKVKVIANMKREEDMAFAPKYCFESGWTVGDY
jgi:hypothetical protein